jgi:hypothetical protein
MQPIRPRHGISARSATTIAAPQGSDGWFEACLATDGSLQIRVPDNCCCCPVAVLTNFADVPTETQTFHAATGDGDWYCACAVDELSYEGDPQEGDYRRT